MGSSDTEKCKKLNGIPGAQRDPNLEYCNATHDSFSCWPTTAAGSFAEIKCPKYSFTDHNKNVTRQCFDNGTWDKASYNACVPYTLQQMVTTSDPAQVVLYTIGYAITTIALLIAFGIFVYFRSLRCLRNTIHCHLIVAFLLNNISYIILANTLLDLHHDYPGWLCRVVVTASNYFMTVPFFWMFVEGLYLYTTVVWAFSLQKIKLWYYILIGWGAPMVSNLTFAFVKWKHHDVWCWIPYPDEPKKYEYITYGPIIAVLVVNVFFIIKIIWVLWTKLRASNTLETRRSRKAVRATFILLPLLGLTFILFIHSPVSDPKVERVFHYITAIMQSLQGLFVAIIYCFMNGEVKTVLRKKLMSFQESRSLTRYTKSSIFCSPHRSSGYAMHQLSVPDHGKGNSDSKRYTNGRRGSGLSRTEDPDSTDACTCMIENIT